MIPFAETTTKLARSFQSVLADVVGSIRDDREPVSSATIGWRSLEIILAAYASAATGRTVDLPLDSASPVYTQGVLSLQE